MLVPFPAASVTSARPLPVREVEAAQRKLPGVPSAEGEPWPMGLAVVDSFGMHSGEPFCDIGWAPRQGSGLSARSLMLRELSVFLKPEAGGGGGRRWWGRQGDTRLEI